jgi:D-alanyl-D-alanine carboxypeptidase
MPGAVAFRSSMRKATTLLTALALTVLALMAGARAQAVAAQFDPATTATLSSIVEKGMTAAHIPGMAVGIWIPGRGTYVRQFGTDNITTGSPFRVDDHIRIASITKTFTATAILQLVDQGRLKLSDHLSSFVKGIRYGDDITIKEMLNMTSGIYDFTNDAAFLARYEANPNTPGSDQTTLEILRRHDPSFIPGTAVEYSDSNYVLLGMIVQQLTHQTLTQYMQTHIFDRLGMSRTSYPTTPAMPSPFAHGYFQLTDSSLLRDVTFSNPNIAGGAGAIISTLGDLKLWAEALATGALLSPATQAERLQTVLLAPGKIPLRYGLGILNINGFLGHNGAIAGYGSAMFYLPSAHATFVVEGNNNNLSSTIPTSIFVELAYYLFPQQFPNGI